MLHYVSRYLINVTVSVLNNYISVETQQGEEAAMWWLINSECDQLSILTLSYVTSRLSNQYVPGEIF